MKIGRNGRDTAGANIPLKAKSCLDARNQAGQLEAQDFSYGVAADHCALNRACEPSNAPSIGRPHELGKIAHGHAAALVLVRENPLANINAQREPEWVMRAGQVLVGHAVFERAKQR